MKRRRFFSFMSVALAFMLLYSYPTQAENAQRHYDGLEIRAKHEPVKQEVKMQGKRHRVIRANVSAYTSSIEECGKSDGITASGRRATPRHTIAMDGVPFGTIVEIEDVLYRVEDRFGGGYTDRIDIYMESKEEALRFGRKYIDVKIMEEG